MEIIGAAGLFGATFFEHQSGGIAGVSEAKTGFTRGSKIKPATKTRACFIASPLEIVRVGDSARLRPELQGASILRFLSRRSGSA